MLWGTIAGIRVDIRFQANAKTLVDVFRFGLTTIFTVDQLQAFAHDTRNQRPELCPQRSGSGTAFKTDQAGVRF